MAKDQSYEAKLKRFLIPILRKRSLYWVGRNEAKKLARRDRGFYECNSCHKLFGTKEVHVDHRIPIINPKTSFTNWDDFIKSLFCDVSNLQVLCILCHSVKSTTENELRTLHRKKKRKKDAK